MDRAFLEQDIDELLRKLNVDEKISLLGAPNWWNTNGSACSHARSPATTLIRAQRSRA
jgi:hypothetical protein